MRKLLKNIALIFTGTAVGTVAGILLAPTKGSNARRTVSYYSKKPLKKLEVLMKNFLRTGTSSPNRARIEGQVRLDRTVEMANALLQDAGKLATRIE